MPLYPHSILKKPSEFPPVPFNLDEEIEELEDIIAARGDHDVDDGGGGAGDDDDNESLDILLPNRDLNDFSDFDRPATKPGQYIHLSSKNRF